MVARTKTMFVKPKSQALADMVSLRNPSSARGSIRELGREFNQAFLKDKKLRIARATMLAANRAAATVKRRGLSMAERKEFREIARIYKTAAVAMFAAYRRGGYIRFAGR